MKIIIFRTEPEESVICGKNYFRTTLIIDSGSLMIVMQIFQKSNQEFLTLLIRKFIVIEQYNLLSEKFFYNIRYPLLQFI